MGVNARPGHEAALDACIRNADRLVEDAHTLCDIGSYSSTVALSILAQEEFAKALLLRFVIDGAIPWTPAVRRSFRDHSSKHLLTVVMSWLSVRVGSFLEQCDRLHVRRHASTNVEPDEAQWPDDVAHALNLYRFAKLGNWEAGYTSWVVAEDLPETEEMSRWAAKQERKKQDALYVRLGRVGEPSSLPERISAADAHVELDRAEEFQRYANEHLRYNPAIFSEEYRRLAASIALVFSALQSLSPAPGDGSGSTSDGPVAS